MAFEPEPIQVPTTIGNIFILLRSLYDPHTQEISKDTNYEVVIYDQDGHEMTVKRGDLWPQLTPEQQAWFLQFADDMRALAQGFLPPP